jgi:hypothetical protein
MLPSCIMSAGLRGLRLEFSAHLAALLARARVLHPLHRIGASGIDALWVGGIDDHWHHHAGIDLLPDRDAGAEGDLAALRARLLDVSGSMPTTVA